MSINKLSREALEVLAGVGDEAGMIQKVNPTANDAGLDGGDSGFVVGPEGCSTARPASFEVKDVVDAPLLTNRKKPYYQNKQERPAHRAMVELSAQGYTVKEIAEMMGVTPVCVNNILRQPMLQQTLVNEVRRVHGEDEQVVQLIKENVVAAIETLSEIMHNPDAKHVDRMNAADKLLDRRYGKANQPINRNTDVDLAKLSDAELVKMMQKN